MQIYEASFGNVQSMDYETCRFVCTSMTRGLAMLKIWNMKISCFVAGLRSIQCIIIRHVLAPASDEICKVLDLHTFAAHL